MSQPDRVLKMLRDAGSRGIHSHTFVDAEPRILRGAAVIHSLKRKGHDVESIDAPRNGKPGVLYVLKTAGGQASASVRDAGAVRDQSLPSGEGAQPSAVHDEATPLFGDGQPVKQSATSAYNVFEDAA